MLFRSEKGASVGAFEFVFGLKHTLAARTYRSGAMCMRLLREDFMDVLKVSNLSFWAPCCFNSGVKSKSHVLRRIGFEPFMCLYIHMHTASLLDCKTLA